MQATTQKMIGMFPTLSSAAKTKSKNPYDERRLLEQNKRIQKENNAPLDFPNFIREGHRIDSTHSQGFPARIRMGTNALVSGFEEGIKDMRPGGKEG
ncbi:FKBP-type peptidyl-prolyl cis-trans isomerase domain [Dillenia turbinata]|uniref:peptidylprolyl isomerase n=1 Tax=Dillenia turbinata TaxID=194707 RepID=A0AAN8UN29_9MAGN